MSIPQNIRMYNCDQELEAEVNTSALATFTEFMKDFQDANGFVMLRLSPDDGALEVYEPTRKETQIIMEGRGNGASA